MAVENEKWRLSTQERMFARELGINDAFAEHLGGNAKTLQVIAAGNVLYKTLRGDIGHLAVMVSWTDGDRWHMHNVRIAGDYTAGLNNEQLTAIGAMAMEETRPVSVHDFTTDAYGLALKPQHEVIALSQFTPEQANFGIAAA